MDYEKQARGILEDTAMADELRERLTRSIVALCCLAINDKLEEVALELKKLEEGVYTTAQTPSGLVRAMKVK